MVVLTACLLLASFQSDARESSPAVEAPVRSEFPAEPVELTMRMRGPQPGVEVMLNGDGPFFFVIDTGGQGYLRVDRRLRERLGLEVVGTVLGGDPTGRVASELAVVNVESLLIGDLHFENVPALSRDYGSAFGGVDGILCYSLFEELVLTLDYPGRVVRIEEGALAAPEGAALLELTNQRGAVPIFGGRLGELPCEFYLDTGKMGGVGISPELAGRLERIGEPEVAGRGRTVTGDIVIHRARFATTLVLGDVHIEQPLLEYSELLKANIVGSVFLAPYRVSLDPAHGLLWLRTPEQEARLREQR